MFRICIVSVLLYFIHSGSAQRCVFCNRTPPNLNSQFVSSCLGVLGQSQTTTCNKAYADFKSAFAYKLPDSVRDKDYLPYFKTLPIIAAKNQTLFWSGTFPIVKLVSENDLVPGYSVVSSTNTPSSMVINNLPVPTDGLAWCGNLSGVDYFTPCKCRVQDLFWAEYSGLLAVATSDHALFLADGERCGGAFSPDSFFATVELPNMTASVNTIVAIVIHEGGKGESCVTGSVDLLRNTVVNTYKKKFNCFEVIGSATKPDQAKTVATCVAGVIANIQQGRNQPTVTQCVKSMEIILRSMRRMRQFYGFE